MPTIVKVTADREEKVREVLDDLENLFGPNVARSRVLPSAGGGYHGFLTLLEAR